MWALISSRQLKFHFLLFLRRKWIDRLRQANPQVPVVPLSDVPYGWTNDPVYLRAQIYFIDGPDNIKKTLKEECRIPANSQRQKLLVSHQRRRSDMLSVERYLGRCSEDRWIWSAENYQNDWGAWLSDIPPRTGRDSRYPSTGKEKMGMADRVVLHGLSLAFSLIESTFISLSLDSRVFGAKTDPSLEHHWRICADLWCPGSVLGWKIFPLFWFFFETSNITASIWFHQERVDIPAWILLDCKR